MPDDKRPDQRFRMIALEMSAEYEPLVIKAEPDLIARNDALECPRCGLTALEIDGLVAACLGCPPPAPTYVLPDGFAVELANIYRCSQCGRRSRVTAELRDINLHCRQCARLTFHARQTAPAPKKPGRPRVFGDETFQRPEQMPSPLETISEPLDVEALQAELIEMRYAAPSVVGSVAGSEIVDGDPDLNARVAYMVLDLGIEDPAAFSLKRRERNANNPRLTARDASRQTGRTWSGVLNALARCFLEEKRRLWVRGANPAHDKQLCGLIREFRNRLNATNPQMIAPIPFASLEIQPRDTLVYFDHSYYEARPRRTPGLNYKP